MSLSPTLSSLARRLFPHRQFYLRSRGQVQFFEFTPAFQMTVGVAALALACWAVYASVVVIFKEQIISAKTQRYKGMQAAYEVRVSEMQRAYDELSGLLVFAEERFQNATLNLETRRKQLMALLTQKRTMDEQLREVRRLTAAMARYRGREAHAVSDAGANVLLAQPYAIEPSLRQSRVRRDTSEGTIAKIEADIGRFTGKLRQHHVVRRIVSLEHRLDGIHRQQLSFLRELLRSGNDDIDKYQSVLAVTGLDVDQLAEQVGVSSRGGPLGAVAVQPPKPYALADDFEALFSNVRRRYERLDRLANAAARIPLVTPVAQGGYRASSDFGYRTDPITGRPAFHAGADLAANFGTPVLSTAPGRVVASERRGGYGLMVEIDHGRGIRTRYGHLQASLVKVGDFVQVHQKIATMGSTGRSTGPHVHYEIWFNNKPRDPTKFFDAGQRVFRW